MFCISKGKVNNYSLECKQLMFFILFLRKQIMSYHLLYDYLLHNRMVLLSHHIISNAHLWEYWL